MFDQDIRWSKGGKRGSGGTKVKGFCSIHNWKEAWCQATSLRESLSHCAQLLYVVQDTPQRLALGPGSQRHFCLLSLCFLILLHFSFFVRLFGKLRCTNRPIFPLLFFSAFVCT